MGWTPLSQHFAFFAPWIAEGPYVMALSHWPWELFNKERDAPLLTKTGFWAFSNGKIRAHSLCQFTCSA